MRGFRLGFDLRSGLRLGVDRRGLLVFVDPAPADDVGLQERIAQLNVGEVAADLRFGGRRFFRRVIGAPHAADGDRAGDFAGHAAHHRLDGRILRGFDRIFMGRVRLARGGGGLGRLRFGYLRFARRGLDGGGRVGLGRLGLGRQGLRRGLLGEVLRVRFGGRFRVGLRGGFRRSLGLGFGFGGRGRLFGCRRNWCGVLRLGVFEGDVDVDQERRRRFRLRLGGRLGEGGKQQRLLRRPAGDEAIGGDEPAVLLGAHPGLQRRGRGLVTAGPGQAGHVGHLEGVQPHRGGETDQGVADGTGNVLAERGVHRGLRLQDVVDQQKLGVLTRQGLSRLRRRGVAVADHEALAAAHGLAVERLVRLDEVARGAGRFQTRFHRCPDSERPVTRSPGAMQAKGRARRLRARGVSRRRSPPR